MADSRRRASSAVGAASGAPKRIIVCCDGTWKDSLGKEGSNPPTNVTRISRVLCRTCSDGTTQVISYSAGVGNGNIFDRVIGGTLGLGLDREIREAYSFICANYVDGDAIVLIGFSRGAYTARSVADMIASVGLLTTHGQEHFFTVFEDYENLGSKTRNLDEFLIPGLAPYRGETAQDRIKWEDERSTKYRQGLKALGYTRDTYQDGVTEIRITALGVWDTVGALGIPPAPVIGLRGFTNTQISAKVDNAFQALALDEPRYAFRPALWERVEDNNHTNLKQVWFPGTHGNVGGGWHDQELADITLAWMCDQLSSVGVEFNHKRMRSTFTKSLRYAAAHPYPWVPPAHRLLPAVLSNLLGGGRGTEVQPWAAALVLPSSTRETSSQRCDVADCPGTDMHPSGPPPALWAAGARSWALGQMRYPSNIAQVASGTIVRRPGLAMRADPDTNEDTAEPLLRTGERIHSCVRVRLSCHGLATDDRRLWECEALTQGAHGSRLWQLERGSAIDNAASLESKGPRELELGGDRYPSNELYPVADRDNQWRWVFVGQPAGSGDDVVPQSRVLPEEPMVGYWERLLLAMTAGNPDVWRWAEDHPYQATSSG